MGKPVKRRRIQFDLDEGFIKTLNEIKARTSQPTMAMMIRNSLALYVYVARNKRVVLEMTDEGLIIIKEQAKEPS